MTIHCPDCLRPLDHKPCLKADGRCARCKSQLKTRDDRRAERAANRRDPE